MEDERSPASPRNRAGGSVPGRQCALDQLAPRPLLPVAQQPLVTYALRWMASGGLRDVTICANSAARAIRARLKGSAFGLRLDYLEDWSPRGAAGCVRDAGIKTDADTFVVADGTAVPVVDLAELLEDHQASEAGDHRGRGRRRCREAAAERRLRLRPSGLRLHPGGRLPGHQGEADPAVSTRPASKCRPTWPTESPRASSTPTPTSP